MCTSINILHSALLCGLATILGWASAHVSARETAQLFQIEVSGANLKSQFMLRRSFQYRAKASCEARGFDQYEIVEYRFNIINSLGRGHAPTTRGSAHGSIRCYKTNTIVN